MSLSKLALIVTAGLALAGSDSFAGITIHAQRRAPRGGSVFIPLPDNIRGNEAAVKKERAELAALSTSLAAINKGDIPGEDQAQRLARAMTGVVDSQAKPDAEALSKLAADLNAALAGRSKASYNSPRDLAIALHTILNPNPAFPDRTEKAKVRARAILRQAGATDESVTAVVAAFKDVKRQAPRPAAPKSAPR